MEKGREGRKAGYRWTGKTGTGVQEKRVYTIQGSILVKIFDQDICFQKLLIKIKTATVYNTFLIL